MNRVQLCGPVSQDRLHYNYDSSQCLINAQIYLSFFLGKLRTINKSTSLFKIGSNRLKILCIKEYGYLEIADSGTRDASSNYKLKSAKTDLFKHSFKNSFNSSGIDTYVGFSHHNEDQEEEDPNTLVSIEITRMPRQTILKV